MSIKFALRVVVACLVAGGFSLLSAAQQTSVSTSPENSGQSAAQAAPSAQQPSSDKSPSDKSSSEKSEGKTSHKNSDPTQPVDQSGKSGGSSGTSNDRLFFTLPNFLTLENAGQVPPLTTKQKYSVVARSSFDYVVYPWYAFLAGVAQAQNSEPGYGQGAEGYSKRFGAAFADSTIESFTTGAVLPFLLRQDPRYFQSGHGSFVHRTIYAMSRNLITRADSGRDEFNYSEIVGGALAAAISTYGYHPKGTSPSSPHFIPSDRTLTNTAKVWGTQYGYDTLTLVVKEFWPDIRRKVFHKSRPD